MNRKEQIDKLEKELQVQKNIINSLVTEIEAIRSSRSWRVTAPCRVVGTLIRAMKYADRGLVLKGINSLKKEGPLVTFDKVSHYLNNRRQTKLDSPPLDFCELLTINNFSDYIEATGGHVYGKEIILKKSSSYALLITHEASLTGAPMALRYLALSLLKKDITPIFLSPNDGGIVKELCDDQIPVVVYPKLLPFIQPWLVKRDVACEEPNLIYHIRNLFDIVIANTIVTAPVVKQLIDTDTPVLWWIHEAEESYSEHFLRILPEKLSSNIKVFTGGSYAKNVLHKYRPMYLSKVLLYPVPDAKDCLVDKIPFDKKGKMLFLCVGTLQPRKAQDKLVEAIIKLPLDIRNKALFLFIGRNCSNEIFEKVKSVSENYPENVSYIEEVSQKDLNAIYSITDVLVCPSFDDPMPIVVTDALCRSKLVLCSDRVGTADLLKKSNSGIVYPFHDVDSLVQHIQSIIECPESYSSFSEMARSVYEKHFSPEIFDVNLSEAISFARKKELRSEVSIIIPTFNAGGSFEKLICSLKGQNGLDKIEIIVVDSGSNDQTLNICRQYGVNLIQISQAEFSHSFARNLGASHASGDILLFMTQDALPSSTDWVKNMIFPLINENIAAVSCLEQCPPKTDLYYRYNSYLHNRFLSTAGDICSFELVKDAYTLRQLSSLNDTNCAIKASIFRKFLYRNSYAEDLDLGMRLIKKGYRIKYVHNNPVIHGHNRHFDYYLKRSYIETKTLDKMLDYRGVKYKVPSLLSCCLAYIIIETTIKNVKDRMEFPCTPELVIGMLQRELYKNRTREKSKRLDDFRKISKLDTLLVLVLQKIYLANESLTIDEITDEANEEVSYYLNNDLSPFVCENYEFIDSTSYDEIADCLIKRLAVVLGVYLARMSGTRIDTENLTKLLISGV